MINLVRIALLQLLWYLFIKYGSSEFQIFYPLIAIVITAVDKTFLAKNLSWKTYSFFNFFLISCGLIIDSSLLNFGVFQFDGWNNLYSPYFLWAVWLIFLPYYQFAFEKFEGKYFIAGICAALFAPISYYSGSKLGNLSLEGEYPFVWIGLMWAIFFPTSVKLYSKIKHQ